MSLHTMPMPEIPDRLPIPEKIPETYLIPRPPTFRGRLASEKTVKNHLTHVFEKLGVESRNAATVRALEVLSKPEAK